MYLSQYDIDLSIDTAILVKFESKLAMSASMSIPSILMESTNENPSSAISGVMGFFRPTCINTVFSILHFRPLNLPNSSRQVFSASSAVKVKSVSIEVSSAKASELSVSLFDSFLNS